VRYSDRARAPLGELGLLLGEPLGLTLGDGNGARRRTGPDAQGDARSSWAGMGTALGGHSLEAGCFTRCFPSPL
jgi:hypothetical protein